MSIHCAALLVDFSEMLIHEPKVQELKTEQSTFTELTQQTGQFQKVKINTQRNFEEVPHILEFFWALRRTAHKRTIAHRAVCRFVKPTHTLGPAAWWQ